MIYTQILTTTTRPEQNTQTMNKTIQTKPPNIKPNIKQTTNTQETYNTQLPNDKKQQMTNNQRNITNKTTLAKCNKKTPNTNHE